MCLLVKQANTAKLYLLERNHCEKRAYLLAATPPHCDTQSYNGGEGEGGGVQTMDQPVRFVYVSIHTKREML